jgi:RNA polymerase sigma factor (sigma-70 family)
MKFARDFLIRKLCFHRALILLQMAQQQRKAAVVSITSGQHRAKCAARRNELIENNLDLVHSIAHGIATGLPPSYDVDDLISVGYLALLKAATSYRPAAHGNTPFAAYARPVVRGAIYESVRRGRYRENTRPPISEIPEPAATPEPEAAIDQERSAVGLRAAVATLPSRQQNVLRWYYQDELRMQEVADRLGDVGKCMASRLHTKSLRELRAKLTLV